MNPIPVTLARPCINRDSKLSQVVGRKVDNKGNLISNIDINHSYLGLRCLGKIDCKAITIMRDDDKFKSSHGITNVPSAERLHQRLDEQADFFLPLMEKCSAKLLKKDKAQFEPLDTGHTPLDADVFPMNNSCTNKEKSVQSTKDMTAMSLLQNILPGRFVPCEVELRPGSRHSQQGFIPVMERVLDKARVLTRRK